MNRAETSRVAETSLSAATVATDLDGDRGADSKPMLDAPTAMHYGTGPPGAGLVCLVVLSDR